MLTWILDRTLGLFNLRHKQLAEENERLQNQVAEIEGEVSELRARVRAELDMELGEKTQEVLLDLFYAPDGSWTADDLAMMVKLSHGEVLYHLELLEDLGLSVRGRGAAARYWKLTRDGRRYVMERGLNAQEP